MKNIDRFYLLFFLLLGAIYARGLFIPLMNNDSAHHANIALHMYLTGDYSSLIDQGKDYLDKPHLLFWLAAASYHFFGVTTFAFKFPSFLFTLLGVYSTFRLAMLLYNPSVAKLAALMLSSSLAFILANNDVRMDAILTACIAFSSWQLVAYILSGRWMNVLLASVGMALGFATKGMVGIVVPVLAAGAFVLHQRRFAILFNYKWIAIPLIVFILITPVLYSYHKQFDQHPEKVIRNYSGVSGVAFILWSQNAERFDGSSFGGKSAKRDQMFFLHTVLWAFLPWSFLLVAAFWSSLRDHVRNRFRPLSTFDGLTLVTVSVMMVVLSFSGYKLPHYLNILFPFFAIMTSAYVLQERKLRREKTILRVQVMVTVLMILLAVALNGWSLPMAYGVLAIIIFLAAVGIIVAVKYSRSPVGKAVTVSLVGAVFCNFFLNYNWYPRLLNYQAGHNLAAMTKGDASKEYVFLEGCERSPSFEFYRAELIPSINIQALAHKRGSVNLYTGPNGLKALQESEVPFEVIATAVDHSVSKLNVGFLDPVMRPAHLSDHYLIEIHAPVSPVERAMVPL